MDSVQQVLSVVEQFHKAVRLPFSPDEDVYAFHGDDAEDLIHESADSIGLSREIIDQHFPFLEYFEPEANLSLWPFLALKHLYKRAMGRPEPERIKRSITARAFAELIVGLKQAADAGQLP